MLPRAAYLTGLRIVPERIPSDEGYPFSLPIVRALDLTFDSAVTILVGENGTGKSTVLEALATLLGLPPTGGGRNESADATPAPEVDRLVRALRPSFVLRPPDSWFLRTENLTRFADLLDQRKRDPDFTANPYGLYGGKSLHARSHGEGLIEVLVNRIGVGLFLLDEPEAALSPQRQLALLTHMHQLVRQGKTQFVIATHAPVLMTFPGATLISFDVVPPARISLHDTAHYRITRGILEDPVGWWRRIAADGDG